MSFFFAEKTSSGDKGTHLLLMVVPTPRTSSRLWFLIPVLRGVPFSLVLILLVAVVAIGMIVVVWCDCGFFIENQNFLFGNITCILFI